MKWRLRVVHTTGYRYATAVTQSYNEARLTPRHDERQNLMVARLETVPATRAYKYTDYWVQRSTPSTCTLRTPSSR